MARNDSNEEETRLIIDVAKLNTTLPSEGLTVIKEDPTIYKKQCSHCKKRIGQKHRKDCIVFEFMGIRGTGFKCGNGELTSS